MRAIDKYTVSYLYILALKYNKDVSKLSSMNHPEVSMVLFEACLEAACSKIIGRILYDI